MAGCAAGSAREELRGRDVPQLGDFVRKLCAELTTDSANADGHRAKLSHRLRRGIDFSGHFLSPHDEVLPLKKRDGETFGVVFAVESYQTPKTARTAREGVVE